jgi:hypothetical protein
MKRFIGFIGFVVLALAVGVLFVETKAGAQNGAAPTAGTPKFSTFASTDDLANELSILVTDAEKAVADEEEYKSQIENRFVRDGNTIALVVTALALHDQDNPVKPHAQAILAAAKKLTEAKDYAATKKAVEDLRASLQGTATGEVAWRKISPFKSLMNDEVSNINTKIKNGLHRFEKRTKETASNAATMALIAENAKLYVADTKKPEEGAKWMAFSDQFRAAAADLAAKARAGDKAGANTAMEKLTQTCHDCHAVFNPEKAKTE